MLTARGFMTDWHVHNEPENKGSDKRRVEVALTVPAGSPVAVAVASTVATTPVLLSLALVDAEGRAVQVSCFIVPPWGAAKRGGFRFKAQTNYSDHLATSLGRVTKGAPLTVGVQVLQDELALDPDRQAALDFVATVEADQPEGSEPMDDPTDCEACGATVERDDLAECLDCNAGCCPACGWRDAEGLYCRDCAPPAGAAACEGCGELVDPMTLGNAVDRDGRFCESCQAGEGASS